MSALNPTEKRAIWENTPVTGSICNPKTLLAKLYKSTSRQFSNLVTSNLLTEFLPAATAVPVLGAVASYGHLPLKFAATLLPNNASLAMASKISFVASTVIPDDLKLPIVVGAGLATFLTYTQYRYQKSYNSGLQKLEATNLDEKKKSIELALGGSNNISKAVSSAKELASGVIEFNEDCFSSDAAIVQTTTKKKTTAYGLRVVDNDNNIHYVAIGYSVDSIRISHSLSKDYRLSSLADISAIINGTHRYLTLAKPEGKEITDLKSHIADLNKKLLQSTQKIQGLETRINLQDTEQKKTEKEIEVLKKAVTDLAAKVRGK